MVNFPASSASVTTAFVSKIGDAGCCALTSKDGPSSLEHKTGERDVSRDKDENNDAAKGDSGGSCTNC